MPVRPPAVAGHFYPESPEQCRRELAHYLAEDAVPGAARRGGSQPVGGVVPHAGWVCSAAVAAEVIRALAGRPDIETFVIFGTVHRPIGTAAAVDPAGAWRTPIGDIEIDEPLARAVIGASPLLEDNPEAHRPEHSIEVQVPFVQQLAPRARLLPIMVPPHRTSHEVGRVVAEQARALGRSVVFLGSTDLTHYGPRYHFTPQGVGTEALKWAKEVNDRRIIERMLAMEPEAVVPEAAAHHNACGSGAIAATMAASRIFGADSADLLRHTTSAEVLATRLGRMDDAVGYAGIVFGARTG